MDECVLINLDEQKRTLWKNHISKIIVSIPPYQGRMILLWLNQNVCCSNDEYGWMAFINLLVAIWRPYGLSQSKEMKMICGSSNVKLFNISNEDIRLFVDRCQNNEMDEHVLINLDEHDTNTLDKWCTKCYWIYC